MYKKILVLILSFILMISYTSYSYSKVTIRWWGIVGGPQGEALKALANKYMKLNPEVTIEIREGTLGLTDVAAFLAAISAKQTPELLYWDRFTVAEFAARGAFMPLDEFIASSKFIKTKDMYAYALKEASFKGRIYAVPHDAATHGLAINMTHYKEAGLDPSRPPKDFEEFIVYAKKLTKYDDKGNIIRCGIEASEYFNDPTPLVVLMKSVGADWVSIDGKKCTVNDSRIVAALEAIVRLCDTLGGRQKLQDFISAQEVMAGISYFAAGLTSQYYRGGLWLLAQMQRAKPELAKDVKVFPSPPMPGGKPKAFMGGFSFVIPAGTPLDKAKEAFKFIEFCMLPDNILTYEKACTKIIPYHSAINLTKKELQSRPQDFFAPHLWKDFLDLIRIGTPRTPTPFNFLMYTELRRAVDNATYHKMSPKEALDQAAAVIQKNLDEFYKKER